MNEKTNDEINRIITEKLFGGGCWHEIYREPHGFFSVEKCKNCGEISAFNFHNLDNRDFCNSDADIREAREKLAEKGLQRMFITMLFVEINRVEGSSNYSYADFDTAKDIGFDLLSSSPLQQARAIVRVLEGLE